MNGALGHNSALLKTLVGPGTTKATDMNLGFDYTPQVQDWSLDLQSSTLQYAIAAPQNNDRKLLVLVIQNGHNIQLSLQKQELNDLNIKIKATKYAASWTSTKQKDNFP